MSSDSIRFGSASMIVERQFVLSCLAILSLAAAGCATKEAGAYDPPLQTADAPSEAGEAPVQKSPAEYWVKLDTTKGDVIIEVRRAWSPYGADRFYELAKNGFFDGCRLFRVLPGFVVQTGIAADPQVHARWTNKKIPDDKFARRDANRQSNKRGYVTFAKSARPNSRSTQIYINTGDNSQLDGMG